MKYKNQFLNIFKDLTYRYDKHQVFSDFITFMSLDISQSGRLAAGLGKDAQDEKTYLKTVRRYKREEINDLFAKLFHITILGLENERQDWLGEIYGELELGDTRLGQFFTPFDASKVISNLVVGDKEAIQSAIDRKGYVTFNDSVCGSGGMILAFAEKFREFGFTPATQLYVLAQDISSTAAGMCHIQLSLRRIPAVVLNQDTLTMETPRWKRYTPLYLLMDWPYILSRESAKYEEIYGNPKGVTGGIFSKVKQFFMPDQKPKKRKEPSKNRQATRDMAVPKPKGFTFLDVEPEKHEEIPGNKHSSTDLVVSQPKYPVVLEKKRKSLLERLLDLF